MDLGSSYSLSEINAAFLYGQLKKADEITKKRINIWRTYDKYFLKLEKRYKIVRPCIPKYAGINGHSYFIFVKKNLRDDMLKFLNKKYNGIISLYSITQFSLWKKTIKKKLCFKKY